MGLKINGEGKNARLFDVWDGLGEWAGRVRVAVIFNVRTNYFVVIQKKSCIFAVCFG